MSSDNRFRLSGGHWFESNRCKFLISTLIFSMVYLMSDVFINMEALPMKFIGSVFYIIVSIGINNVAQKVEHQTI